MKIEDVLFKDLMIMDLQADNKEDAIDEMIQKLDENKIIDDSATFKKGIMEREAQTSTGLGDGIAMPHSKNSAVVKPAVLFAKSKDGIDFEALDDENVHLFFMIAAPEGEDDLHLKVLATLARSLADADFVKDLKAANRPQTILDLFSKKEEQLNLSATLDNQDKKSKTPNNEDAFIVAVTACPTGIAHTYMAEEALKET
ncbi:MAG: fructose PTS transporter subunit IIA, partial [Atopostipes suicloacalis]|nr:fructose PTS transporter subunit IIA [Atopostipes suicloacalis]